MLLDITFNIKFLIKPKRKLSQQKLNVLRNLEHKNRMLMDMLYNVDNKNNHLNSFLSERKEKKCTWPIQVILDTLNQ